MCVSFFRYQKQLEYNNEHKGLASIISLTFEIINYINIRT